MNTLLGSFYCLKGLVYAVSDNDNIYRPRLPDLRDPSHGLYNTLRNRCNRLYSPSVSLGPPSRSSRKYEEYFRNYYSSSGLVTIITFMNYDALSHNCIGNSRADANRSNTRAGVCLVNLANLQHPLSSCEYPSLNRSSLTGNSLLWVEYKVALYMSIKLSNL